MNEVLNKIRVVFVPRRSRIRLYKIAKSLKYSGKAYLVLVCEESFYDESLFRGIFDEVHFFTRKNILFKLPKAEKIYRKINERFGFGFSRLKRILDEIKPDIVHAFAEPYNHITYLLKNTDYKVIMTDGADFTGITRGIENTDDFTWKQEKYCFEHVHGIIHKGPAYEIDYYRQNGCKISCPELTWFDHCEDELIIGKEVAIIDPSAELHLIYAGNISTDPKQKYIYYIDFAREMARQKIHFHIYPNPYQYHVATAYRNLTKETPYFHFHAPLSYRELGKEITKYHWGLWWHDPAGGDRDSEYKNKVAIGNKLFTYLESGLPVIVGKHMEYGKNVVEKYGVGLSIEESDITSLRKLLVENYTNCLEKTLVAAEELKLSVNFGPLLEFYNKILSD